ncbi:unnamed protein product [Rotaria socialis]|uniref:Uncharacterized protein n=1 Tax=Rotaria socialis TaxID=392032 RepID=A0A821G785_9BILA|nr:unnamed protein product [Rotaria socialis]CAF3378189.1 unnamed protein product [Rotaria socialis]CAF3412353.1 unnamed protein product [Rotaria socialis]CAF4102887.1 unnamed protein product [Rotaria socialis]CAF4134284.1 unnamed protein product [Rotaria socialis]
MGVNKRISKIVQDTIFTRDLYLREYSPVDDSTFPLSNPIFDRFCSKILPEIGHKIETLYLKGTWTERVFHATNCPNLINLGLCDIQFEQLTMFLFCEKAYSQCHIYSYPYKWEVYNNITNNFRGGLFMSVTKVLLYDEHSFEYEVFLRISKSFPFMRELTINNRKAQNKKQFIKSNNDDQILPIIEYPNLQRLDVSDTHDDYVELFLFDTKIFLPNDLHICTHYQSLKTVTYYFTRYTTGSNCVKLAALYVDEMDRINEHIKNYFPDICIREAIDFELFK